MIVLFGAFTEHSYLSWPSFEVGTKIHVIMGSFSSVVTGSVVLSITGTPRKTQRSSIPFLTPSPRTQLALLAAFHATTASSVTGVRWFSFTPSSTFNNVFIGTCSSYHAVVFVDLVVLFNGLHQVQTRISAIHNKEV